MNRNLYTLAVSFKDEPNVIHFLKFMMDAKGVPLSLDLHHPRSGEPVKVIYRGTSKRGRSLYRYTEGSKAGEVLGG
jgi:hypothetical protein